MVTAQLHGSDDDARALAAALACAITVDSQDETDWIAKKGPESLFSAIRRLVPEASIPTRQYTFVVFLLGIQTKNRNKTYA